MIYLYNKSTLKKEVLSNWKNVAEWETKFKNSATIKLDWFPSDIGITNPIYKCKVVREATRQEQIEELGLPMTDGEYIDSEGYNFAEKPEGLYWKWESPEWVEDTEKKNADRIVEIEARLKEIDFESVRPSRSINVGTATDYDKNKLAELEKEATELRKELQTL